MSKLLCRDIINTYDEAFCIIDVVFNDAGKPVDCQYIEANPQYTVFSGHPVVVGQTISTLFPSTEQFWFDFYGNVAASGISARIEAEHKSLGKWFDVFAFKLRGGEGRRVGVFFRDITERRKAEEALRVSAEILKRRTEELETANNNKDQFISVLSHELRNPLAVIAASLSLMEMIDTPEQISMTKGIIKREIKQLTKLVDDLLDLTRITQNKVKLKKVTIILNDVLKYAALDVKPLYITKDIRLTVQLPEAPVIICADPVRITQCVGNLLNNALKYTQTTGTVTLSLELENNEAVIRVRDNGMGIDQELLEHLFEAFAQADTSHDRSNGGGLGLGLSIVKGIVALHDGKVEAYSEGIGKGSLFTIRLPISV
jgi:signal transduction histidine kinase